VAQVFTAHPERMREAAALIAELGFDGIDINMGCPDKSIMKQGAGAKLIQDPLLAQALDRRPPKKVLRGADSDFRQNADWI
jgi:tRNA-dihydrouridine synthase B